MIETKDVYFEYVENLVDHIMNKIDTEDDEFAISVIGKYEEIKEVFKAIISGYDVDLTDIFLGGTTPNEYSDEYGLGIWVNDGVIKVDCKPVKNDNGYVPVGADECYIFNNCNSRILGRCICDSAYSVFVDEFEEDDYIDECGCPCCECANDTYVEYSTSKEGDMHGFTASKSNGNSYHSYSFYTNDILSKNDIKEMLKDFGF